MELSALTKKRREHIWSCRENGDNSHEIIAGLYSDQSHFIYEILQNADDAGATEVIFELSRESLSIVHNGSKLFDFENVESITTVGSSTKTDDVNSIGTFGAGFKSVFSITKTPKIHSGDFHFKITDFIVPEEIESENYEKNCTKIILPFNHEITRPNDAYEQISSRLQALESEPLLFLRNIKKIQWSTEIDNGHYSAKIVGNRASLVSRVNESKCSVEYFLVNKNIEIDDARLNISVAYLLTSNGEVEPINGAKLFVFFPTNDNTGLKFLVHAPYKTTPSRESIPYSDTQNKEITDALSCLVSESIISLKSSGLLNINALLALPTDPRVNHPLYSSVFTDIKSTLISEPLLPTESGGYESSGRALLAREKELVNLLSKHDCQLLFNKNCWLSSDITQDKTSELRNYLISELKVKEITMQKFCSEITAEFITSKTDSWVMKFYSSISKNKSLYRPKSTYHSKGVLRERPIIRLEDGSHINPENELGDMQVYLPIDGNTRYKTVKKSLTEADESYEFLKSLGVDEPNSITEIKEFIIPKYRGDSVSFNSYRKDFERVIEIWLQADEYRKSEIADLLRKCHFVRSKSMSGKISYAMPEKTYFPTDKLLAWFAGSTSNNVLFLDQSMKLSSESRKLMQSLGVKYEVKLSGTESVNISQHGWYERSVGGFNKKFSIEGLGHALKYITLERSILLWAILIKNTNRLIGYTENRTNQNHPYKKSNIQVSRAITLLSERKWLYGSSRELINLPIDQISLTDLNDDYLKEDESVDKLSKILGLKLDEILAFEEKTGKKVVSNEDFELLQRIKEEQNQTNKPVWTPKVAPDDATPTHDYSSLKKSGSEDLSGQVGKIDSTNIRGENIQNQQPIAPEDRKRIGDWGEAIAKKHLIKKYPDDEVVWLNTDGCVGKGYDFVIKKNGKDSAYYEVKSKTDLSPKLFQISGTQWDWAKKLQNSGNGEMYRILVISNAGQKQPIIKEIYNPVKLWQLGELYADPVSIKL